PCRSRRKPPSPSPSPTPHSASSRGSSQTGTPSPARHSPSISQERRPSVSAPHGRQRNTAPAASDPLLHSRQATRCWPRSSRRYFAHLLRNRKGQPTTPHSSLTRPSSNSSLRPLVS